MSWTIEEMLLTLCGVLPQSREWVDNNNGGVNVFNVCLYFCIVYGVGFVSMLSVV